jgi:hypothetical protein
MTIMKNKSTQGLFEATAEGLSAKSSYASPTIKVVTFQVEHGFAGTVEGTFVGQLGVRQGIETYDGYQQTDGNWTSSDYNPYNEGHVFGN